MKIKSVRSQPFFLLTAFTMAVNQNFAYAEPAKAPAAEPKAALAQEKPTLSVEQPTNLDRETQRLMDDMIARGIAEKKELPEGSDALVTEMADDKSFQELTRAKKSFESPPDRVVQKAYRHKKLEEGDRIYRVAISDKVITISEALDIGLANNVQIRSMRRKVDVARSKVTEARRALFPTVQGVMEFNGGKAQGSPTNLGGRLYKGKNRKVNVTQPLFYGGELVFTVRQAETNLRIAVEEYNKAKGEYLASIASAFYGLVKQEYNFQYQASLFNEVQKVHKRIREERSRKLISEIDFLNADSQYYQVFYQLESAKTDLTAQRLILFQTLFLSPTDEIPVDLRLDFKKVDVKLDDVIDIALRRNPDVKIKEHSLEAAEIGIKIFKAKKLPKIDLRGSYGFLGEVFKDTTAIETDNHDLDLEKEWFFGVGGSMPLGANSVEYEFIKHRYGPTILALTGSEDWRHKVAFNLLDRFADITDAQNAEASYLTAVFEVDKARNDTIVKVKDEFYNLQKSLIQIDASVSKMRYQDKQVAAYRYLVSLQETTVASLFEGLIEQASNKFAFIQAVADYHLSVASLNVAMGDPGHFQSQT